GAPDRQLDLMHRLLERIEGLPGVEFTSLTDRSMEEIVWENRLPESGEEPALTVGNITSVAYPKVMGLQLVQWRWLSDKGAPAEIVINERLARRDFQGRNPLGRRLEGVGSVVGVVANLKYSRLDADPEPEFYTSFAAARRLDGASLVVRMQHDPSPVIPSL